MNNRRITLVRPSQIFDSFMDEFFNNPSWSGNTTLGTIEVNVKELADKVEVTAKIPGFAETLSLEYLRRRAVKKGDSGDIDFQLIDRLCEINSIAGYVGKRV